MINLARYLLIEKTNTQKQRIMKYKIDVCRIGYAFATIEVEAENYEEAQEKALEEIEQTIDARSGHIDDMTTDVAYTQELDENGKVVKNYP